MTDGPAPGYRPCVGIALFNHAGLVFIGDRAGGGPEHVSGGYSWQMPQGGIDEGESPHDAAVRELGEETGVRSITPLGEIPDWLTYDLPEAVASSAWKGRFRGQTQKWFAFRFEGNDSEINVLEPGNGHKAEFSRWRWEHLGRTPDLIVPFKRSVYESVVAAFTEFVA